MKISLTKKINDLQEHDMVYVERRSFQVEARRGDNLSIREKSTQRLWQTTVEDLELLGARALDWERLNGL